MNIEQIIGVGWLIGAMLFAILGGEDMIPLSYLCVTLGNIWGVAGIIINKLKGE